MRFSAAHLVPHDHCRERPTREFGDDGVGQPSPRHGDQRAWDLLRAKFREQVARPWSPRDFLSHSGDHTVEELIDDLLDRQVDTPVIADVATRFVQILADDRMGVVHGPFAAVRLDELELAVDPVRLGVDEGAIHVPQDGGWSDASAVRPAG